MLSQEEIDRIISSLGSGQPAPSEGEATEQSEDSGEPREKLRIRVYDFRRPDKFSKEQMRTIQMLHENFSRHLTGLLSGKLRTMVQASVVSVDQMTYQEFVKGLSNPGIIGIIALEPLQGNLIIELTPSLGFPMIDRLFGGPGLPTWVSRAITDIEQTVLERVLTGILDIYKDSWQNLVEMTPRLDSIQTNPLFTQVIAPNEMVLVVSIETRFSEYAGGINLCIPYVTMETFLPALTTHRWFSRAANPGTASTNHAGLGRRLKDIEVSATCELGRAKIAIRQVLDLVAGDVIVLDTKVDGNVRVLVGNRPKFLGKLGRIGSHLAVKVSGILEGEEGVE